MPEISVVVPVYKVEPYLRRCVDSILTQSYNDFQLILVDDGSPDNCGKICEDYSSSDSRVHTIHRENGGLSAARNSGIDLVFEHSYTEWITFIDSDDWVHPDYLKTLFDAVQKNGTSISIGGFEPAYDDTHLDDCNKESRKITPEDFWVDNQGNATVAWGKLYKTELFRNVRYPVGKLHEDELTTYKLLFSQEYISVTDSKLYMYYQASTSIMRSSWSPKHLDLIDGYGNQLIFFKKNGYRRAFKESKKLFVFGLKNCIDKVKQSDNKKNNYKLFRKRVSEYLYNRYNSKILSSAIFTRLYIRKMIVEQFLSIRFNVLRKVYREEGIKGLLKRIFK